MCSTIVSNSVLHGWAWNSDRSLQRQSPATCYIRPLHCVFFHGAVRLLLISPQGLPSWGCRGVPCVQLLRNEVFSQVKSGPDESPCGWLRQSQAALCLCASTLGSERKVTCEQTSLSVACVATMVSTSLNRIRRWKVHKPRIGTESATRLPLSQHHFFTFCWPLMRLENIANSEAFLTPPPPPVLPSPVTWA